MTNLEQIKKLRRQTGLSIKHIRAALEQSGGQLKIAERLLKKEGGKKRQAGKARVSLIEGYLHDGRIGVLVEVAAETDFALQTAEFRTLAHDLALQIAASNPQTQAALKQTAFIKDLNRTVGEVIKATEAAVGEKIEVRRFIRFEAKPKPR